MDENLTTDVLIPSCLESALSGVMQDGVTYSWFWREFNIPPNWTERGERVLLNFEAVDYETTVFVNGENIGDHTGGYWHFSMDITDSLKVNGNNQLHVFVFDPTDSSEDYDIPLGKQALNRDHIHYTPCTGIWQTVWMEPVPKNHITQLDVTAGIDGLGTVSVTTSGEPASFTLSLVDEGLNIVTFKAGMTNKQLVFNVESPKLWSPSSPTLYWLSIKMGDDRVLAHTAFRTISKREVNGIVRPLLNGEFIFQFGTLNQGYWPDGIYTPPSREAMLYDLKLLKRLGFNMIRKHVKVENDVFYAACDRIGLLVIQDMPSLQGHPLQGMDVKMEMNAVADFSRQFEVMVKQLRNYPCIVTWVIYNEGWGQPMMAPWSEHTLTKLAKELDPTRLVNAITGWHDHGAGDWHDNHHYPGPQCGTPWYSLDSSPYDVSRIAIQGEFGGIGHNVSDEHTWKVSQSVNEINRTYELDADLETFNYRSHVLLGELRDQIERFACSAAVWTQTTDVEGEVNGLMTYDRRLVRVDEEQWKRDIQALYDAPSKRRGQEEVLRVQTRQ